MWIWGSAPSGRFASRTAWTHATSRPCESRRPTWQVVLPMQLTEVSNRLWALSGVAAITFSASAPVRLTI